MSTLNDLITQAVLKLEGIPNIGRVHNRARYVSHQQELVDYFRCEVGGKLVYRGWWVEPGSLTGLVSVASRVEQLFAFGAQARPYVLRLTGVGGFDDVGKSGQGSEPAFRDLYEAVRDAFDA